MIYFCNNSNVDGLILAIINMENLKLDDWISSLKQEMNSNLIAKCEHYNFDFIAEAPKPVPKPKYLWAELPIKTSNQNSLSTLSPRINLQNFN